MSQLLRATFSQVWDLERFPAAAVTLRLLKVIDVGAIISIGHTWFPISLQL